MASGDPYEREFRDDVLPVFGYWGLRAAGSFGEADVQATKKRPRGDLWTEEGVNPTPTILFEIKSVNGDVLYLTASSGELFDDIQNVHKPIARKIPHLISVRFKGVNEHRGLEPWRKWRAYDPLTIEDSSPLYMEDGIMLDEVLV